MKENGNAGRRGLIGALLAAKRRSAGPHSRLNTLGHLCTLFQLEDAVSIGETTPWGRLLLPPLRSLRVTESGGTWTVRPI